VRTRDLQAVAATALLLVGMSAPMAMAQQNANPTLPTQANVSNGLPQAPQPIYTQPLFMRDTSKDYSRPKLYFPNPIAPYTATDYPLPSLSNTPRLDQLLKDGKIYLSLSDAITLALENNLDIAISRINLDIADTDLLRARAGSTLRGVSTGLVTNTLGGSSSTITSGGGPGGTSTGSGGAGAGASGLVLSTNGGGPTPEPLDPTLTGTLQLERAKTPESSTILTGTNSLQQNTDQYNFAYSQGFMTGTALTVAFNNSRSASNSTRNGFSPQLASAFQSRVQQHLLQGFGWNLNGRFIVQAKNDRRITDAAFRQQVLYTINQVEDIYWALVSAYEDEQAKEHALEQSKKLTSDNRKQLEIGTLAPLDVVTSDSQVATDQQALISSQSNLEYQQLVMKQAIARNLNDAQISAAPVVPTDRVNLDPVPEEKMSVEELVQQAYANNPSVEQAVLSIKNDEITIKAFKNGLLPTVDIYGFYNSNALGGALNPLNASPCVPSATNVCPVTTGYGTTFDNLFNSTGPDKGAGISVTIPIRNRTAQADQARSQMEYRQAQMRLQQLYTQIRMQVLNGQFALTNDRAQVKAAQTARDFNAQALDAEQKKYKLGASTTALVLQQQRNLATAENNAISATAAYARDRAALSQTLANTLDRYGINLSEAALGVVNQVPVIPGLEAPKPEAAPKPLTSAPPQ